MYLTLLLFPVIAFAQRSNTDWISHAPPNDVFNTSMRSIMDGNVFTCSFSHTQYYSSLDSLPYGVSKELSVGNNRYRYRIVAFEPNYVHNDPYFESYGYNSLRQSGFDKLIRYGLMEGKFDYFLPECMYKTEGGPFQPAPNCVSDLHCPRVVYEVLHDGNFLPTGITICVAAFESKETEIFHESAKFYGHTVYRALPFELAPHVAPAFDFMLYSAKNTGSYAYVIPSRSRRAGSLPPRNTLVIATPVGSFDLSKVDYVYVTTEFCINSLAHTQPYFIGTRHSNSLCNRVYSGCKLTQVSILDYSYFDHHARVYSDPCNDVLKQINNTYDFGPMNINTKLMFDNWNGFYTVSISPLTSRKVCVSLKDESSTLVDRALSGFFNYVEEIVEPIIDTVITVLTKWFTAYWQFLADILTDLVSDIKTLTSVLLTKAVDIIQQVSEALLAFYFESNKDYPVVETTILILVSYYYTRDRALTLVITLSVFVIFRSKIA